MANQLWCIEFLTHPTALFIPHRLPAFLESPMPFKNWCSLHAIWSKTVRRIPYVSGAFSPSVKHSYIPYCSSSRPDCIFEIPKLWQSGFSRVYSNSCCSCSFEPDIRKIDLSFPKIHSNKILKFQESTRILNAYSKKVWKLIVWPSYDFMNLRLHKTIKKALHYIKTIR